MPFRFPTFTAKIFLIGLLFSIQLPAWAQQQANEIVQTGPRSYSLTLETEANIKTIWKLWEDVENWKSYDTILEYSHLVNDADFEAGAIGYVKAEGAPKTKFELISVIPQESFVESLKLPLWSTLELKRFVKKGDSGKTEFTHAVEFKGPVKGLMYFFLAKTFKEELPLVMGRLKALAEKTKVIEPASTVIQRSAATKDI